MDQSETNAVLSAFTVTGDTVRNMKGEDLGRIEDVMIDLDNGCIAYAVLACGPLGTVERLCAIPWNALHVDLESREFLLDLDRDRLEKAPAFDEDNWPCMADRQWGETVHGYFGARPYWERSPQPREPVLFPTQP
jgi:hypothetical protein